MVARRLSTSLSKSYGIVYLAVGNIDLIRRDCPPLAEGIRDVGFRDGTIE